MESWIRRTLADDGTATVTVCGEIDFANAAELSKALGEAVRMGTPAAVHVELREASFIDSTGLGALIAGYRAATEGGVRFVVRHPSATFRRVLSVTGLDEIFGLTAPAEEEPERTQATGA